MLSDILQLIREDLENVYSLIEKELSSKASQKVSFTNLECSSADMIIRPALVILSSRIYDGDPGKTAILAGAFQFAYMASKMHSSISEGGSDLTCHSPAMRDEVQLPILMGDYLYSKAHMILFEAGITGMLGVLAEIICQVNEGGILRKKLGGHKPVPQMFREIICKETGEFFGGCCRLGACLAGAPEEDQENMLRFGRNLGMAYGLQEQGASVEQTAVYTEKALKYLLPVPDRPEKKVLNQLVRMFSGGEAAVRMVV